MRNIDNSYLEEVDDLIGTRVSLPGRDGVPLSATVKRRKLDYKGQPIGANNINPVIDSRIYELKFADGRVNEYSVNVILENLLDQISSNDWVASLYDEIILVKKDDKVAINKGQGTFITVNGFKRPVITAKGWSVQVKRKDGSMTWLPLLMVKLSNPIDLAEYAESKNLSGEATFNWWVKKL